jgi:hypothetical protein
MNKSSPEVREHAALMVQEYRGGCLSLWAPCSRRCLKSVVRRRPCWAGCSDTRPTQTLAMAGPQPTLRVKTLDREVKGLRRVKEILKLAIASFA